jgi:peroxiredoxin
MPLPSADVLLRIERLLGIGKQQEALPLLVEYLRSNPSSARAWWLMSLSVTDTKYQVDCLERVIQLDPDNELARERLQMLKNNPSAPVSVNPFTTLEMPGADKFRAAEPVAPAWTTKVDDKSSHAVVDSATIPPAASPEQVEPPVEPPAAPPETPVIPKKSNAKWWVIDGLAVVLLIIVAVFLFIYFRGQQQDRLRTQRDYDLQQTLIVAQTLAGLPTSTPRPTSTGTPTSTPRPTRTTTPAPSITLTYQYTPTRTLRPSGLVGPIIGLFAPDINLTDVVTGHQVTLSQYDGKPVLVFFFATWCPHCNDEIASLISIYQTYNDSDLVVLAISSAENLAVVRDFQSVHQMTFPVLLDPDNVALIAYHVKLLPSHFFITTAGRISYLVSGEMTLDQLKAQVDKLLRVPSTPTP